MPWSFALRRPALDLIVWFSAPATFLFFYTRYPQISGEAVTPHLRLLLVAFLALILARMALARQIGGCRAPRAISAFIVSLAVGFILLYYALVLTGLELWGRVISWDLIRTYAIQASALRDALGVSLPGVCAVLAASYLALLAAAWVYLGRFDWIAPFARVLPTWLFTMVLLTGSTVCAVELYSFAAAPPTIEREPVSLTLFPLQATFDAQTRAIDSMRAERLDQLEDAARLGYQPNPAAVRRNVILIVVDALRSDRMGVYGYSRDTTPNLTRLAREGMIRKPLQMRSSCSASVCGLMSLLSSKFIHELSRRPITLQEVLKLHGYRIHLMLGGDHANFYGLRQLYGDVDSYQDAGTRRGWYMNDDAGVLHDAASLPSWDGTPIMMQFHLMSAHGLGKRNEQFARFTPAASYVIPGNRVPPLVDNFYDNGVVQADEVIHQIMETLRRKGYLKSALVVVTADHGEALGEHGRYTHAHGVDEQVLRIPLLLIAQGYRPAVFSGGNTVASQVDVAPTVLAELGIARPATWSGMALQEPVTRAYTFFQEAYAAGLIDHRDPQNLWKYWADSSTGQEYAYGISSDPAEASNVIHSVAPQTRRDWRVQYLQIQSGGTAVAAQP